MQLRSKHLSTVVALAVLGSIAIAQSPPPARFVYTHSGFVRGKIWEDQGITFPLTGASTNHAILQVVSLPATGGSISGQGSTAASLNVTSSPPESPCQWACTMQGGSATNWAMTASPGGFTFGVSTGDGAVISFAGTGSGGDGGIDPIFFVRATASHSLRDPEPLHARIPLQVTADATVSLRQAKAYRRKLTIQDGGEFATSGNVHLVARLHRDFDGDGLLSPAELFLFVTQWEVGAQDSQVMTAPLPHVDAVEAGDYVLDIDVQRWTSDHFETNPCAGGSVNTATDEWVGFSVQVQ